MFTQGALRWHAAVLIFILILPGFPTFSAQQPQTSEVVGQSTQEQIGLFSLDLEGGIPAAGRNVAYHLAYSIAGEDPVAGVILEISYPAGLKYLSDNSGLPPNQSPGYLRWDLGEQNPTPNVFIDLFFSVSDDLPVGTGLTVAATIRTSTFLVTPVNRTLTSTVTSGSPDIELNSAPNSWDPAAGSTFMHSLYVCNLGPIASSAVTLSGTLNGPAEFIFVDEERPTWAIQTLEGAQFSIRRPSINNDSCAWLNLGIHVFEDVPEGTPFTIALKASTGGDSDGSNNRLALTMLVSPPRLVLRAGVSLDETSGPLVAGSRLVFRVGYSAYGNLTVPILRIQANLPTYTTYEEAWIEGSAGIEPLPLAGSGSDWLAWEVGQPWHNYDGRYWVALRIAESIPPGTVLTETVSIEAVPNHEWIQVRSTESSTWSGQIWGHGPNLGITGSFIKWTTGIDDQPQAWLHVTAQNLGDQPSGPFSVTLDYPAELLVDPEMFYLDPPPDGWEDDPLQHRLILTYPSLASLGQVRIYLNEYLNPEESLESGQWVYHQVRLTEPDGEANPADNQGDLALATGPDIDVSQDVYQPPLAPGQDFSLYLVIANQQVREAPFAWAGPTWLTWAQPPGLELVSSDPLPDQTEGSQLTWNWPDYAPDTGQAIHLTVRIKENIDNPTELLSSIEAGASLIDPDLSNNQHQMVVQPGYLLAFGDSYTQKEDTTLQAAAPGVLANDLLAGGGLQASLEGSGPVYGTLTLNPDGSFSYDPAPDYAGADSFRYIASGAGMTMEAVVTLVVEPVNDPPRPVDDTVKIVANDPAWISVLENDVEVDGESLRLTAAGAGEHGTTALEGDGIRYTPAPGFMGLDRFTYTVVDESGLEATAEVTVIVGGNKVWLPWVGK